MTSARPNLFALAFLALLLFGVAVPAGHALAIGADGSEDSAAVFERLRSHQLGETSDDLPTAVDLVIQAVGDAELRHEVEGNLVALLAGEASSDCRRFACRQLALVGSARAVPLLATFLDDAALRDVARFALERIADPTAGQALRDALETATGPARVSLINSLGARREWRAVPQLKGLAREDDMAASDAAIRALGHIGGGSATGVLEELLDPAQPETAIALLESARTLETEPGTSRAAAIFVKLHDDESLSWPMRLAALGELVQLDVVAVARVVDLLDHADPTARAIAREMILRSPAAADFHRVVTLHLEAVPAERRARLLAVLADRGDASLVPTFARCAGHEASEVRVAALRGLGSLDDAGSALPLLLDAAQADGPEAEAARLSLASMRGASVDAALLEQAAAPDQAASAMLLEVLGERGCEQALPLLLQSAATDRVTVRTAALGALGEVLAIPHRRPPEQTIATLRKAWSLAEETEQKEALLMSLARIERIEVLEIAEAALDDAAVAEAAAAAAVEIARALCDTHPDDARRVVTRVRDGAPTEEIRREAVAAIDYLERFEDFVPVWLAAGPCMDPDTPAAGLLDVEFDAEKPGAQVEWKVVEIDGDRGSPGRLDLQQVFGGSDRVAYLFVDVFVPGEVTARLEIGSDDGVKVWLGGEVVHRNPAMRGYTASQDVVDVTLREGWNPLLLKISQGGGDWAAGCRIRAADGTRIEGLRFRAGEEL